MHAHNLANPGALAVVAALVAAAPTTAAAADTSPPGVRELSAAWWQWALSIPAAANPLTDPIRASGAESASTATCGFSAGSINTAATVDRTCTIPAGTRILLAVINGECSVVEDSSLGTPAALRACAKGQMDLVTAATARLDGRALQVVRRQSPLFSITLPPGNVLGIANPTPNPSPAVAEGFWMLVGPLVARPTTSSRPMGTLVVPGPDGFTFTQDVTYKLDGRSAAVRHVRDGPPGRGALGRDPAGRDAFPGRMTGSPADRVIEVSRAAAGPRAARPACRSPHPRPARAPGRRCSRSSPARTAHQAPRAVKRSLRLSPTMTAAVWRYLQLGQHRGEVGGVGLADAWQAIAADDDVEAPPPDPARAAGPRSARAACWCTGRCASRPGAAPPAARRLRRRACCAGREPRRNAR